MSFSANDFNPGASKISKLLSPGTQYCTLADIRIDVPSYNPDAIFLSLTLVGPELPDFEGMKVDRMNPSAGTYSGQAAYVKHGKYAFADFTPPSGGATIKRDIQIGRWIANFATALGVYDQMKKDNVSGDTIEEYIANCSKYLCNGEFFYVTIAGKEDPNEYGMSYRMYLPKAEKLANGKYLQPFYKDVAGLKDSDLQENMIVFDATKHIDKQAVVEASAPSPFTLGAISGTGGPTVTLSGGGLTLKGGTVTVSETSPFK